MELWFLKIEIVVRTFDSWTYIIANFGKEITKLICCYTRVRDVCVISFKGLRCSSFVI